MRWFLPLTLLGCAPVVREPTELVRIYPPHEYHTWWRAMERCTGKRSYYAEWQFRVKPSDRLWTVWRFEPDGLKSYIVMAVTRDHVIDIAAPYILDERVVKHEMIHALGVGEHDYKVFVTACGVENDSTILEQSNPINLPDSLLQHDST